MLLLSMLLRVLVLLLWLAVGVVGVCCCWRSLCVVVDVAVTIAVGAGVLCA